MKLLAALLSASVVGVANGGSLKDILKNALVDDPILLEARANQESAVNRVQQAEALHWPGVRLVADQTLLEHRRRQSNVSYSKFNPRLEASVNLYSFGAIESEIAKNKSSEKYYRHKYGESREQLAYTIGDLYLTALGAKNAKKVLKGSLKRHQAVLNNLAVILESDKGRESEYVQAEARKILVEQQINDYQTLLESTLSTLSKYTQQMVTEADLKSPFKGLSEAQLLKNYQLKDPKRIPSYMAQQAEIETKSFEIEVEKAKQYPQFDLVGSANRDEQRLMVRMSWDVFNRATKYMVKEKQSLRTAAKRRLEQVIRDVVESARLALINIRRNKLQLKTLASQIKATKKVADFYALQFEVAQKTLLEVLNIESELSDVKLARVNVQDELNRSMLGYLRSQGKIAYWAGVSDKDNSKNNSAPTGSIFEDSASRDSNDDIGAEAPKTRKMASQQGQDSSIWQKSTKTYFTENNGSVSPVAAAYTELFNNQITLPDLSGVSIIKQ